MGTTKQEAVEAEPVLLGVDGDRGDPQLGRGPEDANCDLRSVRNQYPRDFPEDFGVHLRFQIENMSEFTLERPDQSDCPKKLRGASNRVGEAAGHDAEEIHQLWRNDNANCLTHP